VKRVGTLVLCAAILAGAGCNDPKSTPAAGGETDKIKAALDKLPAEDRSLAAQQVFCAVETDNRLGSMGTPFKVMVKNKPVFLCCKGCEKRALEDPDKTLQTVEELKSKTANPQ
jgi:hypothetical protein